MHIGLWDKVAVLIIDCYIGLFVIGFMQVLYLGRAPHTKETLINFREKCRVTRRSRVFHGLTGSQWTPGFWGVTDRNVFHARVKDRISREISGTKVVQKQGRQGLH